MRLVFIAERGDSMGLEKYLSAVPERLRLIIPLLVTAVGISVFTVLFIIDPVCETNTTFYIVNRSSDSGLSITYNDIPASRYLVKDYRELINFSRRVRL
jgi:capsular polysaccharide biosynthesis protein